jgi:P pilus assembly chaperone PapD
MKRLQFSALLVIASLSIAAVGSAALSSLSFDRTVYAGQILVDTDSNVAVQITNTSNYTGLVKTEADGKVSLNLNQAINNDVKSGFNTDALFSIGSSQNGVIKIKNNSDLPITVSLSDTADNNAIQMAPVTGSSTTIGVGSAGSFYFTVNTNGQDAAKTLNGVLHVEGNQ